MGLTCPKCSQSTHQKLALSAFFNELFIIEQHCVGYTKNSLHQTQPVTFQSLLQHAVNTGPTPYLLVMVQSLPQISYKQIPRQEHTEHSGTRTMFRHRVV